MAGSNEEGNDGDDGIAIKNLLQSLLGAVGVVGVVVDRWCK